MGESRDLCFPQRTKYIPYFDILPDELFVEILRRLSQDLVHRFKCVAKRWLYITSNHSFIKCYIDYNACLPNTKPPFALFYQKVINDVWRFSPGFIENPLFNSSGFSLDFLPFSLSKPSYKSLSVKSSSNGLLLSTITQVLYCVCNPITKQWITLPRPSIVSHPGFVCKSTGSGYSFRIVHLCGQKNLFRNVEIYDSESRQWTEVNFNKGVSVHQYYEPLTTVITCNGLIHWLTRDGHIIVYDPYNISDATRLKTIRMPNHKYFSNGTIVPDQGFFGMVNDFLVPINHEQYEIEDKLRRTLKSTIGVCKDRFRYVIWGYENLLVWELEDYDTEKWRLVQGLWLNKVVTENLASSGEGFYSVVIHSFDEDILFLVQGDGEIVLCNTRLKKSTIVGYIAGGSDRWSLVSWFPITLPWWPVALPAF